MSKIYLFRHAQASYGADDYDQLSSKGKQQAAVLGLYLTKQPIQFDKIFVGPLKRQIHTYEIVAEVYRKNGLALPEAIPVSELKEHEGTHAVKVALPQLAQSNPYIQELIKGMTTNPKMRRRNSLLAFQYFMDQWVEGKVEVPNVEPWLEFRQSVKNGLNHILNQTGRGETIAAFTSGGTISSITADALHIQNEQRVSAMNFSVRNTSFSTFLYSKEQFNLLSFNEIPHLPNDLVTFV